jgi:hypothetical protein
MAQPDSITRLLDALAPLMQRQVFHPQSDRSEWTGKFNIFSWERRSWRLDVIRVLWRVGPPRACLLDGQWSVSVDGVEYLASTLNAVHARRRINQVDLPKAWPVVGAALEARWRAALVADADRLARWLRDSRRRPCRSGS